MSDIVGFATVAGKYVCREPRCLDGRQLTRIVEEVEGAGKPCSECKKALAPHPSFLLRSESDRLG